MRSATVGAANGVGTVLVLLLPTCFALSFSCAGLSVVVVKTVFALDDLRFLLYSSSRSGPKDPESWPDRLSEGNYQVL